MADTIDTRTQHRRPHPQPMAVAYLEFDLARESEQLHSEPEWSTGQNAKTLVKYDDLRIVLIALRAHTRMPGHALVDPTCLGRFWRSSASRRSRSGWSMTSTVIEAM